MKLKALALLAPALFTYSSAFAAKLPLDKLVECQGNEGVVQVVGNAADGGATSSLSIKLNDSADFVTLSNDVRISDEGLYLGKTNGALGLPAGYTVLILIDELHVRRDTRTQPVLKMTDLVCELK